MNKMKLLRITILDLLPAHRQNFIRQFFLNLKFDFPHQLLLRLIPDLQVELPKQNKRKAISQEVILIFCLEGQRDIILVNEPITGMRYNYDLGANYFEKNSPRRTF